jgi:hypothetical protein
VIEEVHGKVDVFTEDSGYLYKFVTRPGPFNFVEGEDSTPRKAKKVSRPATPGSTLGKRKRRRKEEEEEAMDCDDGVLFFNEYASISCDEESLHTVATPTTRGRRSAVTMGSDVKRKSPREPVRVGSAGTKLRKPCEGTRAPSGIREGESPPKRCRVESGSVASGGGGPESLLASGLKGDGDVGVDPAILTKVWKELTLNR